MYHWRCFSFLLLQSIACIIFVVDIGLLAWVAVTRACGGCFEGIASCCTCMTPGGGGGGWGFLVDKRSTISLVVWVRCSCGFALSYFRWWPCVVVSMAVCSWVCSSTVLRLLVYSSGLVVNSREGSECSIRADAAHADNAVGAFISACVSFLFGVQLFYAFVQKNKMCFGEGPVLLVEGLISQACIYLLSNMLDEYIVLTLCWTCVASGAGTPMSWQRFCCMSSLRVNFMMWDVRSYWMWKAAAACFFLVWLQHIIQIKDVQGLTWWFGLHSQCSHRQVLQYTCCRWLNRQFCPWWWCRVEALLLPEFLTPEVVVGHYARAKCNCFVVDKVCLYNGR